MPVSLRETKAIIKHRDTQIERTNSNCPYDFTITLDKKNNKHTSSDHAQDILDYRPISTDLN